MARDLRVALWHVPLMRDGPGLLLRDLVRQDAVVVSVAKALSDADADIIVLTRFDYDATGATLRAFADLVDGDHAFVQPLRSNAGIPTAFDMDGDGRLGEAEDAQAFGRFPGQEALAVLSRFPIDTEGLRSFNDILWRDLPDALVTEADIGLDVQRLSSGGHWIVPVILPDTGIGAFVSLLIGHAGPPVFDGLEDRNGRRNRDELRLWAQIINDETGPFVFMVNTNLDPDRGDGYRDAMSQFLLNQRLVDPLPDQITAHWDRPGPMRVSYVLPSPEFEIGAARVWPVIDDQQHSLITVDLKLRGAALP